jgi:hypothetical protein
MTQLVSKTFTVARRDVKPSFQQTQELKSSSSRRNIERKLVQTILFVYVTVGDT